jgi:hypothetical protein
MGIILLFLVASAIVYSVLATGVAGALVLLFLHLVREHHPAWRWLGALLLLVYAGLLLYRYWQPRWSDTDVPEGLRELWAEVGSLVRLWPLFPALIALVGAVVVLLAHW